MKNLLIYVNPRKWFDKENEILIKLQIDNSLDLDWKTEDIVLATNFGFAYRGVKAIAISDRAYCEHSPNSTKATATIELFRQGAIENDKIYWTHDLDVYQLEVITDSELQLEGYDMGMTDYGRMPRLNFGSVFFRKSAEVIRGQTR